MPVSILSNFQSVLVSRSKHFKPKSKLVVLFLENSEAKGLREFFSWFSAKQSSYHEEIASYFSGSRSYCTIFVAYSPELPYILLMPDESCSDFSIPENFFEINPFEFDDLEGKAKQDSAREWFNVFAEQLIGDGEDIGESEILCISPSNEASCVIEPEECSGKSFEFESEEECADYKKLFSDIVSIKEELSSSASYSIVSQDSESSLYGITLAEEINSKIISLEDLNKLDFVFADSLYLSLKASGTAVSLSPSGRFELPSFFSKADEEIYLYFEVILHLADSQLTELFSTSQLSTDIETSFIPKSREPDEPSEAIFLCDLGKGDIACTSSCDNVLFEFDSETGCTSYLSDWLFLEDLKSNPSDYFYLEYKEVDSNSYGISLKLDNELSSFLSDMKESRILSYSFDDKVQLLKGSNILKTLKLADSRNFVIHKDYDSARFLLSLEIKDKILKSLLNQDSLVLEIDKNLPEMDFAEPEAKYLCLEDSSADCVAYSNYCSGNSFELESSAECNSYKVLYSDLVSARSKLSASEGIYIMASDLESSLHEISLSEELEKTLSRLESTGKIEISFSEQIRLSLGNYEKSVDLDSNGEFSLPSSLRDNDEITANFDIFFRLNDPLLSQIFSSDKVAVSREITFTSDFDASEDITEEGRLLCRLSNGNTKCISSCENMIYEFSSKTVCNRYRNDWLLLEDFITSPEDYFYLTSERQQDEDIGLYYRVRFNLKDDIDSSISRLDSVNRISFSYGHFLKKYQEGYEGSYRATSNSCIISIANWEAVSIKPVLRINDPILITLLGQKIFEFEVKKSLSGLNLEGLDFVEGLEWHLCLTDSGMDCSYYGDKCVSQTYQLYHDPSECAQAKKDYFSIQRIINDFQDSYSLYQVGSDYYNTKFRLSVEEEHKSLINDLEKRNVVEFEYNDKLYAFNKISANFETSSLSKEELMFSVSDETSYVAIPFEVKILDSSFQNLFDGKSVIKRSIKKAIKYKTLSPEDIALPKKGIPLKLETVYQDTNVFLISDKDWRDVLSLVPVTTWHASGSELTWCSKGYNTPTDVCVYPTLVFHEESNGIDVDAIIEFLKQYNPKKVTLVDKGYSNPELGNLLVGEGKHGVGLPKSSIETISPSDYLSFWSSFDNLIYCEDDYELALPVSVYASHRDIPLIIENSVLEPLTEIKDRNILCVGEVANPERCDEIVSLQTIYDSYCQEASCSKQIYVNPDDLNDFKLIPLQPSYTSGKITHLFQKNSLLAPFLAAAKEEIIFPLQKGDFPSVDMEIYTNLLKYSKASEPVYKSYHLGSEYSEGYISESNDYYYAKDSLELKIPNQISEEIASASDIKLYFGAEFLECDGDFVDVTVSASGEEIWTKTLGCTNKRDFFNKDQFSSPSDVVEDYIEIPLPAKLTTDKLRISFEGASLLFYDAVRQPRYSFYEFKYSKGKGSDNFYCDSRNMEDCFLPYISKDKIKIEGGFSNTESFAQDRGDIPLRFSIPTKQGSTLLFRLNFFGGKPFGSIGSISVNGKDITPPTKLYDPTFLNFEKLSFVGHSNNGKVDIVLEGPSSSFFSQEPFSVRVDSVELDTSFLSNSFVTIFGSNKFIDESIDVDNHIFRLIGAALDPAEYARLFDISFKPDAAIGRIKGFSTSDVSSLVARSLFYEDVLENKGKVVLMTTADPGGESNLYVHDRDLGAEFGKILSLSGLQVDSHVEDTRTYDFNPDLWKNNQIILYLNHGSHKWAGIPSEDIPLLDSSIVSLIACSTCSTEEPSSFCLNAVRKGAVSVIPTVGLAYAGFYVPFATIQDMLDSGLPIGESFKRSYMLVKYQNMYTLLGDPTLKLPGKTPLVRQIEDFKVPYSGELHILD